MRNWLSSLLDRPHSAEAQRQGPDSVRSLVHKFRRILELNNTIMEKIAEMEQALGGEFIFDNAFLNASVRELARHVHQVVYSLNAMASDRYVELYDQYEYITGILEDILSGGLGPHALRLTLAFPEIHWESLPLVGLPNACLAELLRMPETGAVDGFVVTVTGCRAALQTVALPGPLPEDLALAVREEAEQLFSRRGGACALTLSPCPAGPGEMRSMPRSLDRESSAETLEQDLAALLRLVDEALPDADLAIGVREAVFGEYQGTLMTLDRGILEADALSINFSPDPSLESAREYYLLRRTQPFPLLRSEIAPKNGQQRLPDGKKLNAPHEGNLLRGGALLDAERQRRLAEAGMLLERAQGVPQKLVWRLNQRGDPRILDVEPLPLEEQDEDIGELSEELAGALPLLHGGTTAQAGVMTGTVVHVRDTDDPDRLPLGAVVVARASTPRLSPFLLRAGALITELGSPIGHLATLAREYRIPAVVGAKGALTALEPGAEVTLDASVPVVYKGAIASLLRHDRAGSEFFATDPEYTTLRRLLRFIMPLRLVNPDSKDFSPDNCRSYHDIIHYVHERSVEELLETGKQGKGATHSHRLVDNPALNMGLVDAGGGLPRDADTDVTLDQVLSEPLRYFVLGLDHAWNNRGGVNVSMRDIISGMQRTSALLSSPAQHAGRNLAIVAPGYCNISLRMGYHFNVIDAMMGDTPNQNHIYFRFAGGFADNDRKYRRVGLLHRILARMHFNVAVKGDLITARLKVVDRETMAVTLGHVGLLSSYARQLDLVMDNEESMDLHETSFKRLVEEFDTMKERNDQERES